MAKYKPYNYDQVIMLPITLKDQLEPGTLEHTIHELVEKNIDMSMFEERYKNDDTGAPAIDPKILLKVILFAYSRGTIGSRPIERCCRENILFMALSGGFHPDHSTISHFVSTMSKEIESIFCDILLVCEQMDLLGGTHFSLDGLKLPSNASKECSGTFKELKKKRGKLREKLKQALSEHIRQDRLDESDKDKKDKQIKRLQKQVERLEQFLENNKPKQGKTKSELQSNITDNESAKMPTAHGVVQGYNAQAMVDSKHQIIIHAQAFGNGQDHDNLEPMIDNAKKNMTEIGKRSDYLQGKILTADNGYHNKDNLQKCKDEKIDAYIPDQEFRKRDTLYADQDRFKDGINPRKREQKPTIPKDKRFSITDFVYDAKNKCYICPNNKVLKRNAHRFPIRNIIYDIYRSKEEDCKACNLRLKCLSKRETKRKYLLNALEHVNSVKQGFTLIKKMKEKIDSPEGKRIYSRRLAIVEPVFANIRSQKRLDRFSFRGKVKVNIQWKIYALIHNIEKIMNYGIA
jgi:transposase